MAHLRFYFVVVTLFLVTLFFMPVQWIAIKLNLNLSHKLPMVWHKIATRLVGLKIRVSGEILVDRPMMIVSNHVSWIDIPVLGSIMELCFIAKSEVSEMPGANILSHLQRTIYIARDQKTKAGEQAQVVTNRLLDGDVIVLFGEGTTHDGNRIGSFKSSLLGAAQFALKDEAVDNVLIQPVSIAYTHLHGMPMGRYTRAKAAWYGDMKLGGHAKNIILQGAWDVEVVFGKPIIFDENTNRREIAKLLQAEVRNNFLNILHKRQNELVSSE